MLVVALLARRTRPHSVGLLLALPATEFVARHPHMNPVYWLLALHRRRIRLRRRALERMRACPHHRAPPAAPGRDRETIPRVAADAAQMAGQVRGRSNTCSHVSEASAGLDMTSVGLTSSLTEWSAVPH